MLTVNQLYGKQNFVDDEIKKDISFNLRCCIPGVVQSYNPTNNTAEIQPAIREKIFLENGEARYVDLPLLINVPVAFPSSSSVFIKFPIKQGDEVLVLFSDLSIDNFWEKGKVQNPIESRRHDLSDGIAIPCRLSLQKKYRINFQDGIHINSDDGPIRVWATGDIELVTGESDTSVDDLVSRIVQLEEKVNSLMAQNNE